VGSIIMAFGVAFGTESKDPASALPDTPLAASLREQGILTPLVEQLERRAHVIRTLTKDLPAERRAALDVELARIFEPGRLARAVYGNFDSNLWPEFRPLWSAWATRPGARHADTLLLAARKEISEPPIAVTAERRVLLRRFSAAVRFHDRLLDEFGTLQRFAAECGDSLSAASAAVYESEGQFARTVPPDDELADAYLAPALRSLSDDDLLADIAFAESPAGMHYYAAINTIGFHFDMENMPAIKKLLAAAAAGLEESSAHAVSTDDGNKANAIYANVAKLMSSPRPEMDSAGAFAALAEAHRLNPNDARILTELGKYATNVAQRVSPPDVIHKLYDADALARAQAYLEQAIALEPANGDAFVYIGYIEFVRDHLDQADTAYRKAETLHAATPWLRCKRADLDYARGAYEHAAAAFREILADPLSPYAVASTAFRHLKLTAGKLGRPALFVEPARAYVAASPWAVEERNELAAFGPPGGSQASATGAGDLSGQLEQALGKNDTTALRALLKRGADPNTQASNWPTTTTLLFVAMLGDLREAFAVLLDAGADPTLPQAGHLSIQDMCAQPDVDPTRTWACELVKSREQARGKAL
jgi:tetratricopeptide (TPR) repeat protein